MKTQRVARRIPWKRILLMIAMALAAAWLTGYAAGLLVRLVW
jgi:hypothetical protein